jgi:GH18 family chitinase
MKSSESGLAWEFLCELSEHAVLSGWGIRFPGILTRSGGEGTEWMIKRYFHASLFFSLALLTSATAEFKIIGYVVDWAGDQSTSLNFSQLTHVNYAFVTVGNPTGGLNNPNDGLLRNLVAAAHAKGAKVLVSIGGGGGNNDTYFRSICANAGYRATFINNCDAMLVKYNLDGIDIDWEYPSEAPDPSCRNFTTMMTELGAKMHAKNKLLTAAVVGGSVGTFGYAVETAVFGVVDFLNIMAYDHAAVPHSGYDKSLVDLNFWKKRGLAKDKIVLGMPFYGRNAAYGDMSYKAIVAADPSAANRDEYNGYHYNGVPTTQRKTKLAADSGGGIMFWESSLDTKSASTSLLNAIYSARPATGVSAKASSAANGPIAAFGPTSLLRRRDGISISLSAPATITLDWVDSQGRVNAAFEGHFPGTGVHSIPLGAPLANGQYILRLTARSATTDETQQIGKKIRVVE